MGQPDENNANNLTTMSLRNAIKTLNTHIRPYLQKNLIALSNLVKQLKLMQESLENNQREQIVEIISQLPVLALTDQATTTIFGTSEARDDYQSAWQNFITTANIFIALSPEVQQEALNQPVNFLNETYEAPNLESVDSEAFSQSVSPEVVTAFDELKALVTKTLQGLQEQKELLQDLGDDVKETEEEIAKWQEFERKLLKITATDLFENKKLFEDIKNRATRLQLNDYTLIIAKLLPVGQVKITQKPNKESTLSIIDEKEKKPVFDSKPLPPEEKKWRQEVLKLTENLQKHAEAKKRKIEIRIKFLKMKGQNIKEISTAIEGLISAVSLTEKDSKIIATISRRRVKQYYDLLVEFSVAEITEIQKIVEKFFSKTQIVESIQALKDIQEKYNVLFTEAQKKIEGALIKNIYFWIVDRIDDLQKAIREDKKQEAGVIFSKLRQVNIYHIIDDDEYKSTIAEMRQTMLDLQEKLSAYPPLASESMESSWKPNQENTAVANPTRPKQEIMREGYQPEKEKTKVLKTKIDEVLLTSSESEEESSNDEMLKRNKQLTKKRKNIIDQCNLEGGKKQKIVDHSAGGSNIDEILQSLITAVSCLAEEESDAEEDDNWGYYNEEISQLREQNLFDQDAVEILKGLRRKAQANRQGNIVDLAKRLITEIEQVLQNNSAEETASTKIQPVQFMYGAWQPSTIAAGMEDVPDEKSPNPMHN